MADIIELNCVTRLKIPAEKILRGAADKLDDVVIIGWDKQGKLYFASSEPDGGDVLWLLETAKKALLEGEE
jgi:hypothetical protein